MIQSAMLIRVKGGSGRKFLGRNSWLMPLAVVVALSFGALVSVAQQANEKTFGSPGEAVLALYNADAFACDYVGMTEAAKHYGTMRMFLLRRNVRPE